jgi:hypothetical protein
MGDSWVGIVAIAAGIGVAVAALVHRRYRRRRESALLRSVLDALMREDELAGLTIMARARVSFGARSPAMVLIAGPAMGPETRATALRVARAAAAQKDAVVEDGILLDRRRPAAG